MYITYPQNDMTNNKIPFPPTRSLQKVLDLEARLNHALTSMSQVGAVGGPWFTHFLAGPTRREWGKFHLQYTKQ